MLTPGYALTASECILPSFSLNFTTASLDARVSVARALDTATCVNSSGYIASVNANLPRFNFSPTSVGVCQGLLIEEARSNILLQSQDFSTTWTTLTATVQTDQATAPNNTLTSDKITPDNGAALGASGITQTLTAAAATYTFSAFGTPAGFNRMRLFVRDNAVAGNNASVTVSLVDGSVTTAAAAAGTFTGASVVVRQYALNFYRVELTFTSTGATSLRARILVDDSTATTGDGTKGIYAWGSQIEAGAFATSYIASTTGSVQRNADVVTITGANFSDWFTSSAAAIACVATPYTAVGVRPVWQFDDTTANESICLRGNNTNPELYIVDGGALQAQLDSGTIVANTQYGLCGAFALNSCAVSQNGGLPSTTGAATMPTVTQARIGSDGANYFNGVVQLLQYWPQRILNAETQSFSS